MATRVASAAGGLWSATGAWVGGVVPGAGDDVQLNATSGNITISTASSCRSIDCTGYTGVLTHNNATALNIGTTTPGTSNIALKFVAGMTYTVGGTTAVINIASTSATQQTMDFAGKTIGALAIGTGASPPNILFASAVTGTGNFTHTRGTYDTGNYNVQFAQYGGSNANARTMTLGSSTLTFTAAGTTFSISVSTNLTVTANTATIRLTPAGSVFLGNSVNMNGASLDLPAGGSANLSNGGTWANITRTGTAAVGCSMVFSNSGTTVTGTLTIAGNSDANMIQVWTNTQGVGQTVTAANTVLSNAIFMDITGAGAAAWTGTRMGDGGGNSGITFDSPTTQTFSAGAGFWGTAAKWTSRVPLPQDTVILNGSSGNATMNVPHVGGDVDFTGYTGTLSRTSSTVPYCWYGSITCSSGMNTGTVPNTFYSELRGRGTHTLTMNGQFPFGATSNSRVYMYGAGGTYTQADAFKIRNPTSSSYGSFGWYAGTFDSAGFDFESNNIVTTGSITRTLDFGTSQVYLLGRAGTVYVSNAGTGYTFSAASSTINLPNSGVTTSSIVGNGATFGTVNFSAELATISISGNNTWGLMNVTPGTALRMANGSNQTVLAMTPTGGAYGYQRLPGAQASASITAPDTAAMRISGDLTIEAKVSFANYALTGGACILSKMNSGLTAGYLLRVINTGQMNLFYGTNNVQSSVSLSTVATNGQPIWIRVCYRASDKRTQFFYSTNGSSWTQLGTNVTGAGTPATSTDITYMGQRLTNNDAMNGKLYYAKVYDDITPSNNVFFADFETKALGANTFTDSSSSGLTITITLNLAPGDGRIEITSVGAAVTHTWTKTTGVVAGTGMKLKDSIATGGATFYAGADGVDDGNNTGWLFSNAPGGSNNWTSTPSDTATAADSIAKVIGKFLAETATATDAASKKPGLIKADTAISNEQISNQGGKRPADSATATDSSFRSPGKRPSDTATGTDAASKAVGKKPSDTATTADAAARALVRYLVDSATSNDASIRSVGKYPTDSVTPTDGIVGGNGLLFDVNDVATATEAASRTVGKKPADSSTPTDSAVKGAGKRLSDSVTASDSVAKVAGFKRTIADIASATDNVVKAAGYKRTFTDSVTISESSRRLIVKNLTDTATASDTIRKMLTLSLGDGITTVDLMAQMAAYTRLLGDTVVAEDDIDIDKTDALVAFLYDQVTTSDSILFRINGRSIWFNRDDQEFAEANPQSWQTPNSAGFSNPNTDSWYTGNNHKWSN